MSHQGKSVYVPPYARFVYGPTKCYFVHMCDCIAQKKCVYLLIIEINRVYILPPQNKKLQLFQQSLFASFISSAMLFAVTVEKKVKNERLVHSECTSRSDDRLVREILFEVYMVVIFPKVVVSPCAHP